MITRICWRDGARWKAGDASWAALLRQLDAARDVIVGLDVIVDRLRDASTPALLDDIAGDEAARAVFTAALHRCVDDALQAKPRELGLDGAEALARYLDDARALRDLMQTDVTW